MNWHCHYTIAFMNPTGKRRNPETLLKSQQNYLKRMQQSCIIWSCWQKNWKSCADSRSRHRTLGQNLQHCRSFCTSNKRYFEKKCVFTLLASIKRWQESMIKAKTFEVLTAVQLKSQVFGDVALCLRVQSSLRFWRVFLDCFTLKIKALWSFETSGTIHPMTQHKTSEKLNFQHTIFYNWWECCPWKLRSLVVVNGVCNRKFISSLH